MSRPPRIEYAGALYHVMSRGNARRRIFFGDDDRRRFLRQLRDNLRTYDAVLCAYVLMPNHYHLLVRTRRANLSRFMQRLNTSYALYLRYKRRAPGHVFQGRYRAKLVEEEQYLVALSRYVHLNPVKSPSGLRRNKTQRIRALEEYPWSSYPGYARRKAQQEWICYDLLADFGKSPPAARRHYRAYVRACIMEDDQALREAMRASSYAVGSQRYLRKIERTLKKRRTGRQADRDVDLPREQVDLEVISQAVAKGFRIDPADLKRHGRRAGEAKAVALELACRLTGLNQRQIGEYYGNISSMAVCMARRRFREEQRHESPKLQETLAKLERRITRAQN